MSIANGTAEWLGSIRRGAKNLCERLRKQEEPFDGADSARDHVSTNGDLLSRLLAGRAAEIIVRDRAGPKAQ
jgi:hypothetical protein